MELMFQTDGHLTPQALQALCDGTLNEIERFEVAEHLGFCQECTLRYTDLLLEQPLETMPTNLALGVARQVRAKQRRQTLSRAGLVAASFALTTLVWASGVLDLLTHQQSKDWMIQPQAQPPDTRPAWMEDIGQSYQEWKQQASEQTAARKTARIEQNWQKFWQPDAPVHPNLKGE